MEFKERPRGRRICLKIFADYHTHTRYSHGKGTIKENVLAAREKGLRKIAITDHGSGHFLYGISEKDLKNMREEIERLNDKYDDIEVLLGIEANVISIDGRIDIGERIIPDLDILLIGYHFGALPASLKDGYHIHFKNFAGKWVKKYAMSAREINTNALIRAMERYPVNIITHPGAKADIDTAVLAREAALRGVALEINASHRFMTVDYVRIAREQGAKFVLSSDAHRPERVGEVSSALEIALEAGATAGDIINMEEE